MPVAGSHGWLEATVRKKRGRESFSEKTPDPFSSLLPHVDDLGRTYDALGRPAASIFWNERQFLNSIDQHLLKSNDFTVIDLTGFAPSQIAAVRRHLATLSPAQLAKIIRIGF